MDQQDHIATLCAAGTVGIAATGLALGIPAENDNAYSITPGKRKWPGASSLPSTSLPQTPAFTRRVVSQPPTSDITAAQDGSLLSRQSSLLRQQSKRSVRPNTASESDTTDSRASSTQRNRMFRPRTADTTAIGEKRDSSTSSSWLKRVSLTSSRRSDSPDVLVSRTASLRQHYQSRASESKNTITPNKLVKRSSSQRALSNEQAKGTFFRRPATSHQRSATIQEWLPQDTSISTPATPYLAWDSDSTWRPFFQRGSSRKRHTTSNVREIQNLRTVSFPNMRQPTLLLGSQLEPPDPINDIDGNSLEHSQNSHDRPTPKHKLRRSLSSIHRSARRRHFTDPTVKVTTEVVNGTITSAATQSPLSPASQTSPMFNSSPPFVPIRPRFSFRNRQSIAPSDPTTTSSDNDTRVFTDDDSMEFQSDTAYDSLNTRATASSHSAFQPTKLDTMFNPTQQAPGEEVDMTLSRLVQNANLSDHEFSRPHQPENYSGNASLLSDNDEVDRMEVIRESATNMTPVKSRYPATEDCNATPVASRPRFQDRYMGPLSPSKTPVDPSRIHNTSEFVIRPRQSEDGIDDIDWSSQSDDDDDDDNDDIDDHNGATNSRKLEIGKRLFNDTALSSPVLPSHGPGLGLVGFEESTVEKRLSSIFDWSENQKLGNDNTNGVVIRPRTVHGKQGHDGARSRSSGRKAPAHMHLRSQSVPNSRDSNVEQAPHSISKFGTWGLGHKPVSEEWSDDFEFDDIEEFESPRASVETPKVASLKQSRGVKVPQAIIDRQASVHIQFGQVQEFMLLVEELKQLRARGTALQLLDSHSKQLWEDAESIIDLATINNEDEGPVRSGSPIPWEAFGDEKLGRPKANHDKSQMEELKRGVAAHRSVSTPAPPPHARPRGESLAQAKTFLQTIHQKRGGVESSPMEPDDPEAKKLPFDTQDLKDLVVRSGVITRALKEIVRKAEGLSVSPSKTPPKIRDPAFSQIFNAPEISPCPPQRKPGLPKSKSANSYLVATLGNTNGTVRASQSPVALAL